MRPRLLTDEMIQLAIRDLSDGGRVTGVAVRALLKTRYGARGSVQRIYRLLEQGGQPAPVVARETPPTADPRLSPAAEDRIRLAEERERVHQERWARETDALRGRLAEAERAGREAAELRLRVAELRRALAVAHARIRELEPALPSRAASPTG